MGKVLRNKCMEKFCRASYLTKLYRVLQSFIVLLFDSLSFNLRGNSSCKIDPNFEKSGKCLVEMKKMNLRRFATFLIRVLFRRRKGINKKNVKSVKEMKKI